MFAMLDHPLPSGGLRVVYAMVEALNSRGSEAAVWHASSDFRATWFDHQAPVVTGAHRRLDVGDVLVMPEIGGARYEHLTNGARVVVLNQAHFYTIAGQSPDDESPYPGWPNCVGVLAVSRAAADFVDALVGDRLPVARSTVLVDDVFFLDSPKKRLITAVSGRRADDLASLQHLIARSAELPAGWRFQIVGGLSKRDFAAVLSETAIFVSSADHDGFSLPGAEALAAGCNVVGFHGDGAREYMLPDFATVVADPDLVALRDAVVEAAREFDDARALFLRRRAEGRDFVRERYAKLVFESRTVEAFESLMVHGIGQERSVTVTHMYASPSRTARVRSAIGRILRRLSRS